MTYGQALKRARVLARHGTPSFIYRLEPGKFYATTTEMILPIERVINVPAPHSSLEPTYRIEALQPPEQETTS